MTQTSIPHPTTQQDTVFHPNTAILKKKRMKKQMFNGTSRNGAYKVNIVYNYNIDWRGKTLK